MCKPFRIRCREIEVADIDGIVDLLTVGYRLRKRDLWAHNLDRLSKHCPPPGFPKYGYVLDCDGMPAGVLLTIFSTAIVNKVTTIRCCLATWYVQPEFRSYAQWLASWAFRHKQVTYLNITPTLQVRPILEAQGYIEFCSGRFFAVPTLAANSCTARIEALGSDTHCHTDLPAHETELLSEHQKYGCLSLICNAESGIYPFVFQPRLKVGLARFVRLIYCRDLEDFVTFARPLGRFLSKRGFPLVLLDANGPIDGLIGRYSSGHPKYYKGPDRPRLGDMAYSTRVIYNF